MKRKRHRRLMGEVEEKLSSGRRTIASIAAMLVSGPTFAAQTRHVVLVQPRIGNVRELCLFVTHAADPRLKLHVEEHMRNLLDEGIAVFLIVNADVELDSMQIPADLLSRLSGCLVRENVGFDFAAWAHAYGLIDIGNIGQRLYLINDSIVGPFSGDIYHALLSQIRSSTADMLGLTCNAEPIPHLQSYYLVIGGALLRSGQFCGFMKGVVNLPNKHVVIECYEMQLSAFFSGRGFNCQALFPCIATDPACPNDTIYNWQRLIDLGFPFVKTSVIRDERNRFDVLRMVPERYLKQTF
jgi:hypothetical protein